MTNLINDILMISRLEAKEAEVTYSTVRMVPLLTEIFESVEPIAAEYQVTLHKECEPVSIEASAKQLRELIMNLVSNGIKYNHPGGNVWVEISARGRICACVSATTAAESERKIRTGSSNASTAWTKDAAKDGRYRAWPVHRKTYCGVL